MTRLILDRNDFVNGELGLSFNDVLVWVGIVDEHGDPRADVDSVVLTISSAKPE